MNERDEQFITDMEEAGIRLYADGGTYHGRNYYRGPAAVVGRADAIQDVFRATEIRLMYDHLGTGYIVYPHAPWKP